jgi:hypothetical protein
MRYLLLLILILPFAACTPNPVIHGQTVTAQRLIQPLGQLLDESLNTARTGRTPEQAQSLVMQAFQRRFPEMFQRSDLRPQIQVQAQWTPDRDIQVQIQAQIATSGITAQAQRQIVYTP